MARKKPQFEIDSLRREHCAAPFREGVAGAEIDGICVVSLDTITAGCVATFLSGGGSLDAERIAVLASCHPELLIVLANLNGQPKRYFVRLEKLASMILKAVGNVA
jgi:hypothetical protein